MNKKLLTLGLSLMIASNLILLATALNTHIPSSMIMFILLIVVLVAWRLFLKKDVSIGIRTTDSLIIKKTLLLIFIPLIAIGYFLNISIPNTEILTSMLITSIAIGIYEEVLFRGITLGTLISSGAKPKKAIFTSAIIFSIFHIITATEYQSIDISLLMINTFIMGVVLAYIYYATNNIFYVILIHTIWDLETFISRQYPLGNIGTAIVIILFAMSVLYFSWSYRRIRNF